MTQWVNEGLTLWLRAAETHRLVRTGSLALRPKDLCTCQGNNQEIPCILLQRPTRSQSLNECPAYTPKRIQHIYNYIDRLQRIVLCPVDWQSERSLKLTRKTSRLKHL